MSQCVDFSSQLLVNILRAYEGSFLACVSVYAWTGLGCRLQRPQEKEGLAKVVYVSGSPPPPVSEQNRKALGKEGWDVIEHQSWCIVGVLGKNYELCMSDWLDGSMNDAKTLVAFSRDKLSFGPKSIKNTSASCTSGMEMTVVFWGSPLNLECNGNLQRSLHV